MPNGRPGEGGSDNFTMGILARGNGLITNLVSDIKIVRFAELKTEVGLTSGEQIANHGNKVAGCEAVFGVNETTQVHVCSSVSLCQPCMYEIGKCT